jgi:hypothetical protein
VERPKAAWPFGRQPTRRSQSTTSDLVSLRPRLSRPAKRGESRREGFAKDHAPPLPGPLLHFAEEREIIDRPAGIASRQYIPGTVKLRWSSGRAGGFPGDLNNLVAANVSSRHNYPLLINLRRLTSAATYFLKKRYSSSSCHWCIKVHAGIWRTFRVACKAPGDWRSPRRFAYFRNHCAARSVLECPPSAVLLRPSSAVALLRRMERTGGGPPPLFPEAYQTVPGLIGIAIPFLFRSSG